ncbi:MAG: oligosaccharide flippase family protein [Conexibacter sp.]
MSADAEPQPARPLTGGAAMSAASRIAVAGTGAAATILVARLLGPDGAGGYAIAQTLILLLTVATTLGVEHGVAYYVSSGRWDARDAYRSAQRVAFVSGLAGACLGVAARLLVPDAFGSLSVAVTAVAAGALPFALSWLYTTYLALALDRYEAYALPPAVQSTLALALVAGLGVAFGLTGAIVGFSLAHVATALAVAVMARRALTARHDGATGAPRHATGQLRRAVAFGIKGYAANALQFLNYRLDLFILAAVATAADVGHYAVAIAVTSVMWLLPQALSDVLFPRIAALSARADAHGEAARAFVETKSLRHTVVIVLVSSAVLALALVLLVVPVYGPAFRPAIGLGLILLPGVAAIGLAGTLSATIVGRGRPGYSLAIALITTPITIALYVLLIPALDATGAALASTCSYLATFLLCALFYRRVTGEPVARRFVPTASELADYRALLPAVAEWARGVRARRASGA